MTQQTDHDQIDEPRQKRTRRAKPYPVLTFEDSLVLPRTILDHSPGNQMRRLTLFDRLGRSPDSGPSRQLITTSSRYGLTSGGYQAEHIALTSLGIEIAEASKSGKSDRRKIFDCSIAQFELFGQLYDKLKSKRLPANDVIHDELRNIDASLALSDFQQAAQIFVANVRYIGLIQEVSGSERLISIDQLLEETEDSNGAIEDQNTTPTSSRSQLDPPAPHAVSAPFSFPGHPSVHIDVQIHIDSNATPEQIDHIFSSMARHLYGRNG